MTSKYILIGGYVRNAPDGGKAFCEELIKGFSEPVKILVCLFAEEDVAVWPEKFQRDHELFDQMLHDKKLDLQLAQRETFVEQIKWADAIYLRGGSAEVLLTNILTEIPNISQLLDGKTVAGTSAGADAIAKYYYDLDHLKLSQGLGLLPIKVIVHYKSNYNAPNIDWDKAYQELQEYKEPLELLALAEGEFRVITR